jgi:TRAP-type mannitol/chloroaromatic compound transport system permease small subunit
VSTRAESANAVPVTAFALTLLECSGYDAEGSAQRAFITDDTTEGVDFLKFFLAISQGIDNVTTAVGKIAWWMTLVMVLIGALNVVTRYVGRAMGISLGGTIYIVLQTYAYDFIFLMGAAYVLRRDAHVRVDILFSSLSQRGKAIVDILGVLFFLFPFSYMGLFFAQRYVGTSWRQAEVNLNAGGVAVYPIKTLILIVFGLLMVQGVSELIKNVAFLSGHKLTGSTHERVTGQTEAI